VSVCMNYLANVERLQHDELEQQQQQRDTTTTTTRCPFRFNTLKPIATGTATADLHV